MTLTAIRPRLAAAATLAALALVPALAAAAEFPYSQTAFDQALTQGKPVVVDFAAPWCPTCRAQKPIVGELLDDARFKPITVFVADFDSEAALKSRLRITQQSTLVVFKGGKEVARSTGDTRKAGLAELFAKAL